MQLYYDTISGAYYEVDLSLLIKEVIVALLLQIGSLNLSNQLLRVTTSLSMS